MTRSIHIGQATSRSERPSSARSPVISTLRRRSSSAISCGVAGELPAHGHLGGDRLEVVRRQQLVGANDEPVEVLAERDQRRAGRPAAPPAPPR